MEHLFHHVEDKVSFHGFSKCKRVWELIIVYKQQSLVEFLFLYNIRALHPVISFTDIAVIKGLPTWQFL